MTVGCPRVRRSVLLMTGPGLAIFYRGFARKKNGLAARMPTFAMMAVHCARGLVGQSWPESPANSFAGSFPDSAASPHRPAGSFQRMLTMVIPAFFAEGMKFGAMLSYLTLWSLFV